jgi:hypothetical protein
VVELRTGIKPEDLSKLRNYFMGLCDEILSQELRGISFIINGKHHPVDPKVTSRAVIADLLRDTFEITQEDDYSRTLVQARHSVQTVAQRLKESRITFLFFFSHLEIDHSLGTKNWRYVNKLNEHSELCRQEVDHLARSVRRFTEECKTYVIGYDKLDDREQNYSLCDTDLMNQINVNVGSAGSLISRNYSYSQLAESFENVSALLLFKMYTLNLMLPVFKAENAIIPNVEIIEVDCQTY